jgi:uncharacterized protein YjcR
MQRKRKYDHEAILADYLAGMSTTDIASKYGCAGNLGCILAKRRGVSRSAKVVALVHKANARKSREAWEKSPKKIKQDKIRQRLVEYTKRHGLDKAAAKYEYCKSTVRLICLQHGWNPSRPRLDQQAILRDYLDGMKLREIAANYGCNLTYATQLAKRAGKLRQVRGKQKPRA